VITKEEARAYVDGFVIPIPKKNLTAYQKMAAKAGKVWMEHGALMYQECAGDDLAIKGVGSFLKLAQAKRRRDGVVLIHRLQIACSSRPRECESNEGPTDHRHDGPEKHAVRSKTNELRWV
jgi:uncharacterized protein YbaA (DUF1428 family)